MKVLVTGGLGYIGSHTCVELSKKYSVVIADNLINSKIEVLERLNSIAHSKVIFEKIDLKITNIKSITIATKILLRSIPKTPWFHTDDTKFAKFSIC